MLPFKDVLLLSCLMRATFAAQATYKLGDYKSYSGKVTATPTLTGTQLAVVQNGDASETGIPSGGVDLFLSPDLQKAMQSTIQAKCNGKIDNDCYHSVQGLVINKNTELETRQLGALALIGAGIVGLVSLTFPLWYNGDKTVPAHINIPSAQISAAQAAETASVIAIGTGTASPTILITPTVEPTAVTGAAPAVTTLPADNAQGKKGSVDFKMSKDLASRVQELIQRSNTATCDVIKDDLSKRGLTKRQADLMNSVICSSSMLLTNMQPGGPAADLMVMHPGNMAWLAADATRALGQVVQLARGMAPVFRVDVTVAAGFGITAFALAWEVIVNKATLGEDNVVPEASLTQASSTGSKTTSGCSTKTCEAGCTYIGRIERCSTSCKTATASSCGKSTSNVPIKTTATLAWTADAEYSYGAMTSAPTSTATGEPLCIIYGDSSGKYECECGYDTPGKTGANYKTKSDDKNNICGYTTMPPDSLLATPKTTATAAPSPTASLLVVWRAPPKTGPQWYGFYNEPAGFRKSVVGSCGYPNDVQESNEFTKCNTMGDSGCRVDDARGKGRTPDRVAPGSVNPGISGCTYEEGTVGKADLKCGDRTFSCKAPDDGTRLAITPDNGACMDGSFKIQNVQSLVMVCEMFK